MHTLCERRLRMQANDFLSDFWDFMAAGPPAPLSMITLVRGAGVDEVIMAACRRPVCLLGPRWGCSGPR